MTGRGFCVVAALSSQTRRLPWTRSSRIGKSLRTAFGSKAVPGRAWSSGEGPRVAGAGSTRGMPVSAKLPGANGKRSSSNSDGDGDGDGDGGARLPAFGV